MTNLTTTKIETVELLKLIHRGHARLRTTPKDTDRYSNLKELIDCAVSILVLHLRDEVFIAKPHQERLLIDLKGALVLKVIN